MSRILNSMPIKLWIDGKVFSVPRLKKLDLKTSVRPSNPPLHDSIREDHEKLLTINREDDSYVHIVKVPQLYHTKVQNSPHYVKEHFPEDVTVTYPKLAQEEGITVQSNCLASLTKAVHHIHSIIGDIRDRSMALQFTCIPCTDPNIQERFIQLKNEILKLQNDGIHESIFMCPLKLHITIDVYALLNDSEKEHAIGALEEYRATLEDQLKDVGELKLEISGLECMNNNLNKVDVVYAKVKLVEESDNCSLQKIVNNIALHFYHKGLARRYQDNVKLHMTVINTKYRKSQKRKRGRQSIDATKLMEKFKDYTFGKCDFHSIHLSHITIKRDDGFYKPLAVIQLNKHFS